MRSQPSQLLPSLQRPCSYSLDLFPTSKLERRSPSRRAAGSLFVPSIAAVASRLGPISVPHACMVMARSLSLALSVLNAANRKTFMTSPAVRNDIQIDRDCSAAICEEIGDRLHINLTGEPDRLPQHMMMLVEQMAPNDYVFAVVSNKSETALNLSNLYRQQQISL
jgi:hypothetical protein